MEPKHYIYILYSESFSQYYVGLSKEVKERVRVHNSGKVFSTKAYRPWKLIHEEVFYSRLEARKREKYLKSAAGRRWRKNNLGD